MTGNTIWLILGIVLHTLFALSIFDIYFVSPIVNIKPIKLNKAYSKRVVVAVADGLRHDTFYNGSCTCKVYKRHSLVNH